jgi:hypothetical protein
MFTGRNDAHVSIFDLLIAGRIFGFKQSNFKGESCVSLASLLIMAGDERHSVICHSANPAPSAEERRVKRAAWTKAHDGELQKH